jgi:valyl-tRNA synthetase
MPIDRTTFDATVSVFDKLLKVIHPFMPFITEEIWQLIVERKKGESIMVTRMPEAKKFNKDLLTAFESASEIISAVRAVRKNKDIPNKEKLELLVRSEKESFDIEFLPVISKLCNLSEVSFVSGKKEGAASFMVKTTEYFIPLAGKLDVEGELVRLKEDLDYNRGFLVSVMKKLENERFVKNAPASVLELERKKKSDAESKIKSLEERMGELNKL